MKAKACENLEAAKILINSKQYTSSIHCSYYAVFQYMKYMLAHIKNDPISYEKQDNQRQDSHEYIIENIKNKIIKPANAKDFKEGISSLKRYRKIADYTTTNFSMEESLEQKQNAENLIAKLKTYFGNI